MAENREVKIHGIYKHFKNKYYIVEDVAYHSENKEEYVVYRRLYDDNSLFCLPIALLQIFTQNRVLFFQKAQAQESNI